MAAVKSTMLDLGTKAPDFTLPNVLGGQVNLKEYSENSKGIVVTFICNHCPFVLHVNDELSSVSNEYQEKGIKFIAISSNDVSNYPADSPALMAKVAEKESYSFPYLYDETQEVAKSYQAACTPDFFLFDENLRLIYRGQLDDSRPGNGKPVTGSDLRNAMDRLLENRAPVEIQIPSIGCNIKWKKGNEPEYFG